MNLRSNHSPSSQLVRKSNELIEARYRLSIWEQRLILTLMTGISKQDENFKRYSIRVADFATAWQLESDNSLYEKVQEAADSLVGKTIQLSDDPKISETVSWLAYVKYVRGSGVVDMEFHSSLKPYLLQLKKHFTQYQLGYVLSFRNQYSIRIYELLKKEVFKAAGGKLECSFKYEHLRDLLSVNAKEYRLFADFKRRIITPAVKEISTHTDLDVVEMRYGKTGRRITDITFALHIRSADELTILQLEMEEAPNVKSDHPIIQKLMGLGFSANIAKRYKDKYGIRKIERNIAYTLAKQQEGLVKDVPAYLNKAIAEDMGGSWDTQQKQQTKQKKKQAKKATEREAQSERVHLEKLAAMGGVPLDSLLKVED